MTQQARNIMTESGCDLLCIGPHTDDAEIALGGTIRLLANRGRRVWVCDLTRGELASNADPDERWREAERASTVLGLTGRVQLSLPDGFIDPGRHSQAEALVWVLRRLRPRWVVTVPEPRRHPDHVATPALVRRAVFLARLRSMEATVPEGLWWGAEPPGDGVEPWIPEAVGDTCLPGVEPDLIFDVSECWAAKVNALECYASQFQRHPERHPTAINDPDFMVKIDDRARAWGRRIETDRGEALRMDAVPVLNDLPSERWA